MHTYFDIPYTRTRCIRVIIQTMYPATWRVSHSSDYGICRTWIGGAWGNVEVYWHAVRDNG